MDVNMAYDEGVDAAESGEPFNSMPFSMAQGSPSRPLAFAWRRGYQAGKPLVSVNQKEFFDEY